MGCNSSKNTTIIDEEYYRLKTKSSTKDLVIFLGGSSKKHNYLRKYFEKYCNKPIEYESIESSDCHKHGYQEYTNHYKNKNNRIVAVCPLMDSLISFTDQMNKLWNLPHNDTKTSEQRRNKALMHKTIRDATNNNVRYGKFFLINDYLTNIDEFQKKMKENDLKYPIVIKPPTSGGTDGVRLCYTFKASQNVVKRNLYQENSEKHENVSMMAQEFLNGEEYVVNTVSYDSNHKFTDIWRAHKSFHVDKTKRTNDTDKESGDIENNVDNEDSKTNNDDDFVEKSYPYSILYDYQQFERDIIGNTKIELIVKYVENILNILGIKYGCGHCEVMYLPKENKVCLIELNARMHGGLSRATNLVGYGQMSALAMFHCDASRFLTEIPKYYDIKSCKRNLDAVDNKDDDDDKDNRVTVRTIFLRSKINGKMDMNKMIELRKLKTFKAFARTLYDKVNYWPEFQYQISFCISKLKEIEQRKTDRRNDEYADDDEEEKKQEYLETLNKSLTIIDRIEKVEKTIDLKSCPGAVVLEGKLSDIEEDHATIRTLEDDLQNGLYSEKIY